jgi:hypothetical protein
LTGSPEFYWRQATSDLAMPQQILYACRLCFHLGEEEDGGGEAAAAQQTVARHQVRPGEAHQQALRG